MTAIYADIGSRAVTLSTMHVAIVCSALVFWLLAHDVSAADTSIALRVTEGAGADRDEEIVTSGVPLSMGMLSEVSAIRLLDADGNEVPFVGTVLARWPDESVKWLLLDFHASVAARQTSRFTLSCGEGSSSASLKGPLVSVDEGDRFIEVSTGPLRFRVSRLPNYTFLDGVWLDTDGDGAFSDSQSLVAGGHGYSRLEVEPTPPGPPQEENWLLDAAGGPRQGYEAVVIQSTVEFANALRAVVLVRGEYRDDAGSSVGPFWTRYTAWAGDTVIGVEHFFAFDADVEEAFLRSLSLGLRFAGDEPLRTKYGLGDGETATPDITFDESALVEVMPDRFYHLVPLSVDRRVQYQVVGGRADGGDQVLQEGVEAAGWVRLEGERGTTTIALRDFPRLHPKEIRVEPDEQALRYFLWPERGDKVRFLKMAWNNAQLLLSERRLKRENRKSQLPGAVASLQRDLHMEQPPRRIEAMDVSNTQGAEPVASLVCFVDGQPRKSEYRHFKISGIEGPNDFAMMHQVVTRRFRRLQQEGRAFPDLLLIDGGKGQLSSAISALSSLGIKDQPAIGLAKRLEEVFIPGHSYPQNIPKVSSSLKLLQALRDESHRFAVSFHRQVRAKRTLHSTLEEIEGVGPARRKLLLRHFGSMKRLREASLEDVQAVEGLGLKLAEQIVHTLAGAPDE